MIAYIGQNYKFKGIVKEL